MVKVWLGMVEVWLSIVFGGGESRFLVWNIWKYGSYGSQDAQDSHMSIVLFFHIFF